MNIKKKDSGFHIFLTEINMLINPLGFYIAAGSGFRLGYSLYRRRMFGRWSVVADIRFVKGQNRIDTLVVPLLYPKAMKAISVIEGFQGGNIEIRIENI